MVDEVLGKEVLEKNKEGQLSEVDQDQLASMYPFLHNRKQNTAALERAMLASIQQKTHDHQSVISHTLSLQNQKIIDTAKTLAKMYKGNHRLYTMGNGGSSSDASHIAVEFLHPVTTGRPALAAVDLTTDKTMLTAVANDVGFENVFSRQIIAMVEPGDVVLGVSTSGNSKNLINGFIQAKNLKAKTIALVGGDGGAISRLGLDHCLHVESSSIHRVQECHVLIYHILWDLVHTILADAR